MDIKAFVLEQGADGAGWIKTEKLPIDFALRAACEENVCGSLGKTYACPPLAGTVEEVAARARGYEDFLLFQTIGQLEDSFDVEGMALAGEKHKVLTRAIHDALYKDMPGLLMLSAGGCDLCADCTAAENEPCRCPERVIPSMSAYCIQVSKAAALAGMKYNNGVNTVTYFGGIFIPKGQ